MHIATILHPQREGKAIQEDVYNFNILLDVYGSLPPRPNEPPARAIWDVLDPMAPLGLPVGKRFFGNDYAGYSVGYDHTTTRKTWALIWFNTTIVIIVISKKAD